jgi:hypothetical protein
MTCSHHKESCRGLQFSQDGSREDYPSFPLLAGLHSAIVLVSELYSISADRSIRAIDTSGAISWQILDAHRCVCEALVYFLSDRYRHTVSVLQ